MLGGVLVDAASWRWVFLVNLPVGLVVLVLGALFLPRLRRNRVRFDVLGSALSALGFLGVIYALQSEFAGLGSWVAVAIGAVALIGFGLSQRAAGARALIPAGLLLAPTALASALLGPAVGALTARRSPRLIAVFGLAVTAAALAGMAGVVAAGVDPLWLLLPAAVLGLGNATTFTPLAVIATGALVGEGFVLAVLITAAVAALSLAVAWRAPDPAHD